MGTPPYIWTPEADAILVEMCQAGAKLEAICARLEATYEQIKKRRRFLKLTVSTNRSGLPVAEIRALYDAGKNDIAIARTLGLGISTIRNWRQDNGLPPQRDAIGFINGSKRSLELASVPWPKVCHHARARFAADFGKRCFDHSPEAARDTGGPMPSRPVAGWHSSNLLRAA